MSGLVETRVCVIGGSVEDECRYQGVTVEQAAEAFAQGWFRRHPDRSDVLHLAVRRGSASWSLTARRAEPVVIVEGLRGNE